ncbi:MAG: hypothetical protein IJ150_12765 [Bacteroidales bacterium]|nr:hypothetical protein [Bacteroidales bacterium]
MALFVAGEIFKTLFYWIDGILYTEKEQPTGHRMSDSEIDKAVSEGILTREEGEKAKTANRGGEKFSKRLAEHTRERYA